MSSVGSAPYPGATLELRAAGIFTTALTPAEMLAPFGARPPVA